jgi:hypothetical protein
MSRVNVTAFSGHSSGVLRPALVASILIHLGLFSCPIRAFTGTSAEHPAPVRRSKAKLALRKAPDPQPKPAPKPLPQSVAKVQPSRPLPNTKKVQAPPPNQPLAKTLRQPEAEGSRGQVSSPIRVRPLTSKSSRTTGQSVPAPSSPFSASPGRPGASTSQAQTVPNPSVPSGPSGAPTNSSQAEEPSGVPQPSEVPESPVAETTPEPAEASPSPVPSPSSPPSRGGGQNRAATAIGNHPPIKFPNHLRLNVSKRFVRVQVHVLANASTEVSLLSSTGDAQFDSQIREALAGWVWEPEMRDGRSVESTERFKLELEVE